MTRRLIFALLLGIGWTEAPCLAQEGSALDYARSADLAKRWTNTLFRDAIEPHWSRDGKSLAYRVKVAAKTFEWHSVDLASGEKTRLSEAPAEASMHPSAADTLARSKSGGGDTRVVFVNRRSAPVRLLWINEAGKPVPYGEVGPGETHSQHTYAGHVWRVETLEGVTLVKTVARETIETVEIAPGKTVPPNTSKPAGKPRVFIRDHNLWKRDPQTQREEALTRDGTPKDAYTGPVSVSPDGQTVLCLRTIPAPEHTVHLVESTPGDQLQPKLHSFNYLKPGDPIDRPRPLLFSLATKQAVSVDNSAFSNPWSISQFHWSADSAEVFVLHNERGHQKLQLIAIHATTGRTRIVVDESSDTFIDYSQKTELHWLDDSGELIWASERSGWNHLYLCDTADGTVKNPITSGEWVVRKVLRVDPGKQRIWFTACGIRPDEDPYHLHLCCVNFDGSGFQQLTEGDGTHDITWSPDHTHFIDRWSRVDHPPVHELRRTSDGHQVAKLEEADITALLAAGYRSPDRFTAPGRDGTTPIHGIILRPTTFDPARQYPVIEDIYAGPHGHFVPKSFSLHLRDQAIAELGFVIVRIDGMGTNWRSRAFHDVAWKNIRDAGFPDRIAWMKAAGKTRPWMDLDRVGIFGGSAGGQNAMRALLDHGDFYKAAAADCGCHDNRMDKIWWNEAWMGWPVDDSYAASSNAVDAHKLSGHLLLTVGELDRNVDPASTMQVVHALIAADKDFDLLIIPGKGHGAGETPYASRRRMDFFVRHLIGREPRWTPVPQ